MKDELYRQDVTAQRNPDSGSGRYDTLRSQISKILSNMDGLASAYGAAANMTRAAGSVAQSMAPYSSFWMQKFTDAAAAPYEFGKKQTENVAKTYFELSLQKLEEICKDALQEGLALPGDDEVNEKLNYRFFTHNPIDEDAAQECHGSLNAVTSEEICRYFKAGDEASWPSLLLTSSHALCRDHNDVSGIMQGFHGLIAQSHATRNKDGEAQQADIPLERIVRKPSHRKDAYAPLMVVSSVFNDHNALVNGAKLGARISYLNGMVNKVNTGEITKPTPEQIMGEGGHAMSPASVREGRLLLSLIAQSPQDISVPDREAFESGGYEDPSQLLLDTDTPIILRDDASHILQHVKLAGYSKGGNIQSDAVRLMLAELQNEMANGVRRFHIQKGEKTVPVTDADIRDLVQNMGVLCVNPGLSPLSIREKSLGFRRMTVRSDTDTITRFFFDHDAFHHKKPGDDIYVLKPKQVIDKSGHGFVDALGHYDRESRGYLNARSNVNLRLQEDEKQFNDCESRLQCFFASFVGKVGIAHIRDVQDGIEIEFSTGGDGTLKGKIVEELKAQLEAQNIPVNSAARIERTNRLLFDFDSPNNHDNSSHIRKCFAKALRAVEKNNDSLLVSRSAYAELEKSKATQK